MRVLTWNVNGGYPLLSKEPLQYSSREKLAPFITQIRQLKADLICLQEVHTNSSRSQAVEIAEELSFQHVFVTAASDSHIDPSYKLANAVLSKSAFIRARAVKLPKPRFPLRLPRLANGSAATIHDKYLQVVELESFTLANIHTLPLGILGATYESEDGQSFSRDIENLLITELSGPIILCGDFNFPAIDQQYSRLSRCLELADALPDKTSRPAPFGRTDHILYSGDAFTVLSSGITSTLSDHYPCHADVSFVASDSAPSTSNTATATKIRIGTNSVSTGGLQPPTLMTPTREDADGATCR